MKKIAAFSVFVLVSCGTDVGETRLADVDLTDMKEVQRLGAMMSSEERATFATYIVQHTVSSAKYCGRPLVGPRNKLPTTIREAIEMTQSRPARDAATASAAGYGSVSAGKVTRQWDDLIARRDLLMERQMLLVAKNATQAEHRSVRTKIDDLNSQLMALRPKYLSAGSGLD